MNIKTLINPRRFNRISKEYISRTGLSLVLVNLNGDIAYGKSQCTLCEKLLGRPEKALIDNCRSKMISIVNEAFRWGEGYISTCPIGLIIFAVPIVSCKKLAGGFLSGFSVFPEMKKDMDEEILRNLKEFCDLDYNLKLDKNDLKVISRKDIRDRVSLLFMLTSKYRINDINYLKEINEQCVQQYKIANFLEDLIRSTYDVRKKIFDKQDEIIQAVKLGDKAKGKEILNEFLGSIIFESGMNFEIMKMRIIELVVIISRAAREAGVEARELLGLNYSYFIELNKVKDQDELLYKLNEILESFIDKISKSTDREKMVKIFKMREYINLNFTKNIKASDVAKASLLSVSRALHLFKEETGMSFSDYMTKLRIDYAKYLLLNTEFNIEDIASLAGFYDQSHFSKYFKKKERITPFRFRLKHRSV